MTNEQPAPEFEEIGAPERPCGQCGHSDVDHVLQDIELEGHTAYRTYCTPCDDWHDFVPDPLDV